MLEFLPAIGNVLALALAGVTAKKLVGKVGAEKALVYTYILLSVILLAGALAFQVPLALPETLWPAYVLQIGIGAVAVFGLFKSFEFGKASVLLPLTRAHVLLVLLLGTTLFAESLSVQQLLGALLIVLSAFLIAFEKVHELKIEKGVLYLLLTIGGWGYYFTFLKLFVEAIGIYATTIFLEVGIAILITAYFLLRGLRLSWSDLKLEKFTYKNFYSWTASGRNVVHLMYLRSGFLAIGSLLYSLSVSLFGVVLTSTIAAATPIAEVVFSRIWLKEELSTYKYAAVALMVIGLVIILG